MLFMIEDMVMSHVLVLILESLMHESESSSSHSVLESKSSHESLNLAHESDSSPSPGLEYYNNETEREKIRLRVVSFGEDFKDFNR